MSAPRDPTLVRLTLRPAPGWSGEPMVRLRRLLKSMLRAFGWRCVRVEDLGGGAVEDLNGQDTAREAAPGDASMGY